MDPILLFAAWLLFGEKKPEGKAARAAEPITPPMRKGDERETPAIKILPPTGHPFEKRAMQKRAQDWIPDLIKGGASPEVAKALARWIGLESSGNPLALSPIGERGLLQATKTTGLKGKLFTPKEWESMQSPATSRAEHVRLALHQYGYHAKRAGTWVTNAPPVSALDWLFYAKMHHSRPLDLKEAKPHGGAIAMARDLQSRWSGDSERMKRLQWANVVAFGKAMI